MFWSLLWAVVRSRWSFHCHFLCIWPLIDIQFSNDVNLIIFAWIKKIFRRCTLLSQPKTPISLVRFFKQSLCWACLAFMTSMFSRVLCNHCIVNCWCMVYMFAVQALTHGRKYKLMKHWGDGFFFPARFTGCSSISMGYCVRRAS